MAADSYYPLMTSDPAVKKEYIVKITDQHLNNVFDGKDKNVLTSIIIQDDYMSKVAAKKTKEKKD